MSKYAAVVVGALALVLSGCSELGPPKPVTTVHPHGGVVIFRSGAQTNCSRLTKEDIEDHTIKVKCDQPDGYMVFHGRDIAAVKVFTQ